MRPFCSMLLVASLVAAPAWPTRISMPRSRRRSGAIPRFTPGHRDFQKAVRDRDPDAAAALVRYPITVSIGGKDVTDRTPAAFAEYFSPSSRPPSPQRSWMPAVVSTSATGRRFTVPDRPEGGLQSGRRVIGLAAIFLGPRRDMDGSTTCARSIWLRRSGPGRGRARDRARRGARQEGRGLRPDARARRDEPGGAADRGAGAQRAEGRSAGGAGGRRGLGWPMRRWRRGWRASGPT